MATASKRQGAWRDPQGRGKSEGGEPVSRPHRQARRDRGADTRDQLIQAGLDVFGRLGYEGASTREIAKAANANLAAIVYHFGGKEGLHIAVAEHIVRRINMHAGPALGSMAAPAATATAESARRTLLAVVGTMAEVMLGEAEAERWARFIVREQMQPTAAFDVIYGFMGAAHTLASRLVASALGRAEDEEIRTLVFTLFGQVLVFRVAQTLALRRLGWKAIGGAERERIKRRVVKNIESILDSEAKA